MGRCGRRTRRGFCLRRGCIRSAARGLRGLEEDNCDRRKDADAAANPVKAQIWDHLLYRHWDHYVGPKRSHVLVVSATDGNAVRDLTPRQDIGDAEAPYVFAGRADGVCVGSGLEGDRLCNQC